MNQSKLESLVEACLNTASGFVVSLIVWRVLAGFLGYDISWSTNLFITGIFTVVSVLRSYIWRRFFNRGLNRAVMRFLHAAR